MKKSFFLVVLGWAVWASPVFAHPPAELGVAYDKASQTVSATVIHLVSDPQTHYIFKVELWINERIVKEDFFDRQQDNEQQKISYVIKNLRPGDTVAVIGHCNVSGKRGGSVKVQ